MPMVMDYEDDWVGTPPEGRVTRDRSDPSYWQRSFPAVNAALGLLGVLVVVVIALAAT